MIRYLHRCWHVFHNFNWVWLWAGKFKGEKKNEKINNSSQKYDSKKLFS